MANDAFANIGPTSYPNIAYTNNPVVYVDTALGIPCQVTFVFSGYGPLSGGTITGNTTSLTDSSANWTSSQWTGNTLYLVSGPGAGQFVNISANSSSSLTFASAITLAPGAGTKYMINNGKTVQVTVNWQYYNYNLAPFSETVQALIVNNSNNGNLGF